MTLLKDVLHELTGMFLGDARLSVAILLVVAVAAGLIELTVIEPLLAGGILLAGCLLVLLEAVRRRARQG
ncbi:MAG: hypothetical protein KJ904_05480 [Alphaproteobacteria bacterium]|nr:hypothetical protein [Alphaproteobacteria bacterium]MBU0797615.1 hypothetical protein [Alphaproteobacteria bacterium]MBU0886597.1 hypothetical protein [Alphaproteobacteria bacterium]MBU1812570.1 hypothetical protein [Alphaproteobacteria bacterium]MBU2090046.1 hypothetical protein [Alphaproteobacteria bacterium]